MTSTNWYASLVSTLPAPVYSPCHSSVPMISLPQTLQQSLILFLYKTRKLQHQRLWSYSDITSTFLIPSVSGSSKDYIAVPWIVQKYQPLKMLMLVIPFASKALLQETYWNAPLTSFKSLFKWQPIRETFSDHMEKIIAMSNSFMLLSIRTYHYLSYYAPWVCISLSSAMPTAM